MNKEYFEVYMNPVRQRILQVIIRYKEATSAQIGDELNDIPRASLYRHIKVLLEAGVIRLVREEKKRGAMEKTYALNESPEDLSEPENMNRMIQNILMHYIGEFATYFSGEKCDPQKDMVTVAAATILVTDEEYKIFLEKYAKLLEEVLQHKAAEGRKVRKIAYLSLPEE